MMIVVFGGAFNPPTIAHKRICEHVKANLPVSQFIYLPVSNLYTKRSLASNFHRLQMLKLITANQPNTMVSSIELEDSEYLGTYQSLIRIQERYPHDQVAFVIGADNLFKLYKWINVRGLLTEFKIIVINRNRVDIDSFIQTEPLLKLYRNSFIVLPEFVCDVSSTAFRETFDNQLVEPAVYDYIMSHELYRG